jgi:HD-like signal output (HDOD) protein
VAEVRTILGGNRELYGGRRALSVLEKMRILPELQKIVLEIQSAREDECSPSEKP